MEILKEKLRKSTVQEAQYPISQSSKEKEQKAEGNKSTVFQEAFLELKNI